MEAQVTQRRQIRLAGMLVAVLALLGALLVLAADPGSKEDPLVTVGYVAGHAQFVRHDLLAGDSVRLGSGAEFVIADPLYAEIPVSDVDPLRDTILDLSAGEPLTQPRLLSSHHYLNASAHDVFIKPDTDTVLLLRGEWK